jgi:hypothetical protein
MLPTDFLTMSTNDDAILAGLGEEIDTNGARATAIDERIAELEAVRRPGMTRELLSLLSDAADDDAGMFTLIHAAETGPAAPYVEELPAAFPTLMERAPRWTSIVLMRALNDAETQGELVRQLQGASPTIKAAVREMCTRIDAVSPTFLAKTVPVSVAAR